MVGCRVKIIDDNSQETVQKFKFFKDNKNIRRALKYRMPMCHPALIFRIIYYLSIKDTCMATLQKIMKFI